MKGRILFALVAMLAGPLAVHGAAAPEKPAAGDKDASLTEGEVRRIDRDANKITIRHGPIRNLDMPPMTMVFQVADPAMLDRVKPGDKVSFEAEKVGSGYRVTRLVPVPLGR